MMITIIPIHIIMRIPKIQEFLNKQTVNSAGKGAGGTKGSGNTSGNT